MKLIEEMIKAVVAILLLTAIYAFWIAFGLIALKLIWWLLIPFQAWFIYLSVNHLRRRQYRDALTTFAIMLLPFAFYGMYLLGQKI